MSNLINYEALVLPGGGIKGLTVLGALNYLYTETTMLNNVHIFSGTSIGGLIAVFLALGFKPLEIFTKTYRFDKAMECDLQDLLSIRETYGVKSNANIIDFAMNIIHQRHPRIITLEDVYKETGNTVYLAVSNISEEKMEYFSHITHPTMPLHLAMRMTTNIPFVFTKIQCNPMKFTPSYEPKLDEEQDYFVDGGLLDNCPVIPVDDGVRNVFVIDIFKKNKKGELGLFEYLYKMITLPAKLSHKHLKMNCSEKCKVYELDDIDYNILGINATLKEREEIFEAGYDQMNKMILDEELETSGWGDFEF